MKALGLRARRIVLVVVVAAAALALVGSSGAESGTTFRSKEYHYSVTLPGGSNGWKLSPAAYRWDGLTLMGLDSPEFDDLSQPARGWNVVVADRPLRAGTTSRLDEESGGMAQALPTPRTFVNTTLDNVPAESYRHACSDGYDVTKLTTIHRGKGYIILFASNTANSAVRIGECSTRSADRSDSRPEPSIYTEQGVLLQSVFAELGADLAATHH